MTTAARNREMAADGLASDTTTHDDVQRPAGLTPLADGAQATMDRYDNSRPAAALEDSMNEVESLSPISDVLDPAAPEELIADLGNIFKLLADETRLRILFYLTRRGELHVRALCDLLGQSQPAVSHHLAMLRSAGMIEPRRDGKHNYYHVLPSSFEHLVELVFEAIPHTENSIRFDSYELSYRRPNRPR